MQFFGLKDEHDKAAVDVDSAAGLTTERCQLEMPL